MALASIVRFDKEDGKELKRQSDELRVDLLNAQFDLKSADFPVIVLLCGDDRVTVDRILEGVGDWMDERYIRTEAFAPPSDEERERPRYWRYWRALPPKGQIGTLVGAWAHGSCVARIRDEDDKKTFARKAEHDVQFERDLVEDGALVLKFWFHLDKKEHKKRLKEAKKHPRKLWYIDERDQEIYDRYENAMEVVETYLAQTDTVDAPWHVIDSSEPDSAALYFARTLLAAIQKRLELAPPESSVAPAAAVAVEGRTTVLDSVDLDATLDKDEYDSRLEKQSMRLRELAMEASEARITTVIAFEGWDAAGKGGAIRRLKRALDPRNSRVMQIAAPNEVERSHHYLWRFWQHLPRAGSALIFDRTWYGRVLVERVEGFASDAEWTRAYEEIRDFETHLVEHGYALAKFWLHIDPDEQLRRFEAREQTPYKQYKITDEDYRNRERWNDYALAVDDMVRFTSTPDVPWHLVPSNDKRWARVQVIETVADALEARLKEAR